MVFVNILIYVVSEIKFHNAIDKICKQKKGKVFFMENIILHKIFEYLNVQKYL